MSIMNYLIVVVLFIVVVHVVNEKFFRLQSDISLILFTSLISFTLIGISQIPGMTEFETFIHKVGDFKFEEYLLDSVLCFMLFAGSGKVNMTKFKQNIKPISLLALISTVMSSAAYGVIFFLFAKLLNFDMNIWMCIMLGCIVSPTDPIAATGILNKLGLSKNVSSVIENESLFNDGTGVALFVFIRSLVCNSGDSNFFVVMIKEVFGAVIVAFLVSFIMFWLFKQTKSPIMHIMISVLDVSMAYMICEHFGFSGVIASVVCGMFFATKIHSIERKIMVEDPHNIYKIFWEAVDDILNSILFVMIGLSLLNVAVSENILVLIPLAIGIVITSRFLGVGFSSSFISKHRMPGGYSRGEFVLLMTWSALKGGLSLALAMSTKEILDPDVYLIVLNVTYITILFTVIVQGLSIKSVYHKIEEHKENRRSKMLAKN